MILSYGDIEDLAAAAVWDFNNICIAQRDGTRCDEPRAMPIERFASEYLNLEVSYIRLSSDGSLCGLTAYADTEFVLELDGVSRTIPLRRNQVLLDSGFIQPGAEKRLAGRRRFTLAHECAHQLLFQLETDGGKAACRGRYAARRCYSFRALKNREDWNEWQANALGAALLLPRDEIVFAMRRYAQERRLVSYGGRFFDADRTVLRLLCGFFGVSEPAMAIRLRELGMIADRPAAEYRDPREVWE